MPYYVYVLRCNNGSFYTGYTNNVGARVKQHTKGKGARYTRIHKPKKLVHTEKFATRKEAMKRERQIKRLSHIQKRKLAKAPRKKR